MRERQHGAAARGRRRPGVSKHDVCEWKASPVAPVTKNAESIFGVGVLLCKTPRLNGFRGLEPEPSLGVCPSTDGFFCK